MKTKIKVFIIGIMSLLMIIPTIAPIQAVSYISGVKKHDTWYLADPSTGRRPDREGELLVNGERVFCIDAFTQFKSGVSMEMVDFSKAGISKEMAKELSLIAYFGTQVNGRKTDDYYAITQGLIWKTLHESQGYTDLCYVETNTNPDYPTTVRLWNEILNDVAEYKKTPSFMSQTVTVNAGETITLTDTNNSLRNMIVEDSGELEVSISGNNQLLITGNPNADDTTIITLQRDIDPSQVGTSVAFYNGKDQSLGMFKVADPLEVNLRVKVNKFGKLELTKFNEDKSATVPNTTFRITGPNGFNETHTTDDNGKILLDKLSLGNYVATETLSANGYLINVNEFNFTVTANQTTNVEVSNREPLAKLVLSKEDSETALVAQGDATLEGAVYELKAGEDIYNKSKSKKFYSKGDVVATRTTDKSGKMDVIDNLPLGYYQLFEKEASNGYLIDKTIHHIYFTYEGQTVQKVVKSVVSKEVVQKQAFEIIKISSDGSVGETDTLENAEFTVKLTNDISKVGWDKAKTYCVLKTDKKGYAKSIELPWGAYTVRETKTPENHATIEDFTVIVDKDSRKPQQWRVFNDGPFKALVQAIKIDKETGKTVLLPNTSFKIKNLDTNEYVGEWVWFPIPHYVDTFVTDESGTVTTPNTLKSGNYQLEEIKAPFNFTVDENPIKFVISSKTPSQIAPDGKTPIITVTMANVSVKGKINVKKVGEQLVSVTKDDQGNIKFNYKKLGVSGTEFIIKASDDIYSADNQGNIIYHKDDIVAELTTINGLAETVELPLGKYKIYESIAGDNFVLNTEVKEVELTYKDQNTSVVFENIEYENKRQKVDLSLLKLDDQNNLPLAGATIGLYAKEDIMSYDNKVLISAGELIETSISDEKGIVTFKADLPLCLLEMKEIESPFSYELSNEVIEVDATYQDQDMESIKLEYKLINKLQYGKVVIHKSDLDTKEKLANIEFTISTDKDFKNTRSVLTNKDGVAEFDKLMLGKYFIKESPVNGYVTNDTIYEVEIKHDKDEITINIENKPVEVEFLKVDSNSKNLVGAKLQIIDKLTNKVIEEWTTTGESHKVKYLIEEKEYILKEITAPENYELAEDIIFKAKDGAKIIMEDKLIEIPKIENKEIVLPNTSDNMAIGIWMCLIGISICALGFMTRKKKNNENKYK
ncbi:MAG: SpaA isopeptide-forming pilin-related protein [Bacilli bacterium]